MLSQVFRPEIPALSFVFDEYTTLGDEHLDWRGEILPLF